MRKRGEIMKRTNQKRIISHLRHKHLFQDEKMQLKEIETAAKIDGLSGNYVQMKKVWVPQSPKF